MRNVTSFFVYILLQKSRTICILATILKEKFNCYEKHINVYELHRTYNHNCESVFYFWVCYVDKWRTHSIYANN